MKKSSSKEIEEKTVELPAFDFFKINFIHSHLEKKRTAHRV